MRLRLLRAVETRVWVDVRASGSVGGGVVWMMMMLLVLLEMELEGVKLVFVLEMGEVMLVFFVERGLFVVVMSPFFEVMVLYVLVMGLFFAVIRPSSALVMGPSLTASIVGKDLFVMVCWEARGLVVENVHAAVMYVVDGRYTMSCQICHEDAASVEEALHDPGSYSGLLAQTY